MTGFCLQGDESSNFIQDQVFLYYLRHHRSSKIFVALACLFFILQGNMSPFLNDPDILYNILFILISITTVFSSLHLHFNYVQAGDKGQLLHSASSLVKVQHSNPHNTHAL